MRLFENSEICLKNSQLEGMLVTINRGEERMQFVVSQQIPVMLSSRLYFAVHECLHQ